MLVAALDIGTYPTVRDFMDIFVSLIFILNFIFEIVNSHDKLTKLDQFEKIRISNFSGLVSSQINFQNDM